MKRSALLLFLLSQLVLGQVAYAEADYGDGLAALARRDYKEAGAIFKALAEQGDLKAQAKLGDMHLAGQGVAKSEAEAVKWYTKAAEKGNADAQFALGLMYGKGQGVKQSNTEALKWHKLAAEQGNPKAQVIVGVMYFNGDVIAQSDPEAVKWYRKAAMQGNANGQRLLGEMYAKGRGVQQDYVQAYMWLTLAFEGNDLYARPIRDEFSGKITEEQIAEARKLMKNWRPERVK